MALEESFAASIIKVRATFGFAHLECDPDEITNSLGIVPDEIRRQGELRTVFYGKNKSRGREIVVPFSTWSIASHTDSKDTNDHLRELIVRLEGRQSKCKVSFGQPRFSVLYKATHLHIGNGPFFEADVIAGIAAWNAELWQDIYQVDEPQVGPAVR